MLLLVLSIKFFIRKKVYKNCFIEGIVFKSLAISFEFQDKTIISLSELIYFDRYPGLFNAQVVAFFLVICQQLFLFRKLFVTGCRDAVIFLAQRFSYVVSVFILFR